MADQKISELTEATLPLDGTEDIVLVQGAVSKRCSTQDVADLVNIPVNQAEIITVNVHISSAEILQSFTVPKVIVPAIGAGKVIIPMSSLMLYTFVSTTYDAYNIRLKDGSISIVAFLLSAMTANSWQKNIIVESSGLLAVSGAPYADNSITLQSDGALTQGNGSMDIYFTYTVLTL